jgi:hypothetical protein
MRYELTEFEVQILREWAWQPDSRTRLPKFGFIGDDHYGPLAGSVKKLRQAGLVVGDAYQTSVQGRYVLEILDSKRSPE